MEKFTKPNTVTHAFLLWYLASGMEVQVGSAEMKLNIGNDEVGPVIDSIESLQKFPWPFKNLSGVSRTIKGMRCYWPLLACPAVFHFSMIEL